MAFVRKREGEREGGETGPVFPVWQREAGNAREQKPLSDVTGRRTVKYISFIYHDRWRDSPAI